MQPKVSVIVPVYNVEKYIEKCVRSLFEQTLKELEYIFVDDCSPDGSISIIEQLCNEYTNRKDCVKIIRFEENKGVHVARLAGMEQATGEYLIHCDSDDWIDRDMYSLLYAAAKQNQADVVMCDYHTVDHKGEIKVQRQNISSDKYELMSDLLIGHVHGSLCNKLISRSLYREDMLKPISGFREDLVIVLQIVWNANKVCYHACDKPLYYYYIGNTSITRLAEGEWSFKLATNSLANTNVIIDFLNRNGLQHIFNMEMIHLKFMSKLAFKTFVRTKEEYRDWLNLYRDVNKTFWHDKYASLKFKIEYILILLRLYIPVRNMYTKCCK